MDFKSSQNTSGNTEDDYVEQFFVTVPYCEENLSLDLNCDYLSEDGCSTDSTFEQTDMGSTDKSEEKNKKNEHCRIKKTPMKSKKQPSHSLSNISMVKCKEEMTDESFNEMDNDSTDESSAETENTSMSSLSLITPPKRLSYSPQKYSRVFSRSVPARTSFPPKSNEFKKHFNNARKNKSLEIQDFRYRGFSKSDQKEPVPLYKGHQLIGDSQLVRFAEQVLDMRRDVVYSSFENGKSRRIGYCVSGQNVNDLKKRLIEGEYKIHEKVILLIGTNDLLQRTNLYTLFESYSKILSILKKKAKKIVLLTVPPVPKIHSKFILKTLKELNRFIMDKADGEIIFAIDLSSHYIGYDNSVMNTYYESSFFDGRPDLIHLNKKGFKHLRDILNNNYFDELNRL